MELISDILLAIGAFVATGYCFILGRRLRNFRNMKDGVGAAVASLSHEVDDLSQALDRANLIAKRSSASLDETTKRAELAARRLELLIASLHDLPSESSTKAKSTNDDASAPSFVRSGKIKVKSNVS